MMDPYISTVYYIADMSFSIYFIGIHDRRTLLEETEWTLTVILHFVTERMHHTGILN